MEMSYGSWNCCYSERTASVSRFLLVTVEEEIQKAIDFRIFFECAKSWRKSVIEKEWEIKRERSYDRVNWLGNIEEEEKIASAASAHAQAKQSKFTFLGKTFCKSSEAGGEGEEEGIGITQSFMP